MSYILGALQKADRERSKKQGLSLDNLSEMPVESGQPSRTSGLSLLMGLLITAGIIFVLVLGWTLTQVEPAVEPAFVVAPGVTSDVAPDPSAESVAVTTMPQAPPSSRAPAEAPSALPDRLLIEGIVFVEDRPDQARVFIQGSRYRAGDTYQGLIIQSINASSVTLVNGTTTRTYPIP